MDWGFATYQVQKLWQSKSITPIVDFEMFVIPATYDIYGKYSLPFGAWFHAGVWIYIM